jgi:hypothetical protein
VTDRDREWIARHFQTELPTVTGRIASRHGRKPNQPQQRREGRNAAEDRLRRPTCDDPRSGRPDGLWNTGKSSRLSVKVASVNSAGHQVLMGKVVSGLFVANAVKLDIRARPGIGQCTDASPLVSNTWSATITL